MLLYFRPKVGAVAADTPPLCGGRPFRPRHFCCLVSASPLIVDQGTPASRWTNTVQLSSVPSLTSCMHSNRACSSTWSCDGDVRRCLMSFPRFPCFCVSVPICNFRAATAAAPTHHERAALASHRCASAPIATAKPAEKPYIIGAQEETASSRPRAANAVMLPTRAKTGIRAHTMTFRVSDRPSSRQ